MFPFIDRDPALDTFSGEAPLFPLPNVVLFPQALLPLHIFEPRYRELTADALAGEQLIAMALLTGDSGSLPSIHDVVGLGKIIGHERLDDGRYHLVLRGLSRAVVVREIPSSRMYRIGELRLLEDQIAPEVDQRRESQRLLRQFEASFPTVREHPVWKAVTDSRVPLGAVCDLLASSLPIAPEFAQKFLSDCDVSSRCMALSKALEQIAQRRESAETLPLQPSSQTFPPRFSEN